jgi:hypothetical protein
MRLPLLLSVAAIALAFATPAQAGVTEDVNLIRQQAGEAALPVDDVAVAAAAYAVDPRGGCPRADCSAYPRTLLGAEATADKLYAALGGQGRLALVDVPDGEVAHYPEAVAVGADPRARSLAVVEGPAGEEYLVVTVDPNAPSQPLFLTAAEGRVDVLLPQAQAPTLYERAGSSWLELTSHPYLVSGYGQARLVRFGNQRPVRLAYDFDYKVASGDETLSFHTGPVPQVFLDTSWSFIGMSGLWRSRFLTAFTNAPPLYRQIAHDLDGAVDVKLASCGPAASCAGWDGQRYYISMSPQHLKSPFASFAVLHEFGHIVQFLGLDADGYAAFRQLFAQSPAWRNCFPSGQGGCVPFVELLADQFAFWASGQRSRRSGYNDPPLASPQAFANVLSAHYAFRPPADANPLGSDD